YFFEFMKDLLIVTILLFNLPLLFGMIFQLNDAIISSIQSGFSSQELGSLEDIEEALDEETGVIGYLVIQLVLVVLGIWAFFYYTMRKITLAILMVVSPLIVALYLNQSTKPLLGNFLKEFAGTTLVQSIHAGTFYLISAFAISSDGWMEQIFFFILFIPIGEAMKSLFGLQANTQGGLSRFAKGTGMAGGIAMLSATKGALQGKNPVKAADELRRGNIQGSDKMKPQASSGSSSPSTPSKVSGGTNGSPSQPLPHNDRSLNAPKETYKGAMNKDTSRMMRAGKIAAGAGKIGGAALLGTAGMALGPGGAVAGALGGSLAGGAVGGFVGRGSMAAGNAVKNSGPMVSAVSEATKEGFKEAKQWRTHAGAEQSHSSNLGIATGAKGALKGVGQGVKRGGSRGYQSANNQKIDKEFGKGMHQVPGMKETFKQRQRQQAVGHLAGTFGGETAYHKASKLMEKPTATTKTPKEIQSMAKKDSNGNVAKGAVEKISTGNHSFLQVTDQQGQKQIVSNMDGGNLSLKKGEFQSVDLSSQLNSMEEPSQAFSDYVSPTTMRTDTPAQQLSQVGSVQNVQYGQPKKPTANKSSSTAQPNIETEKRNAKRQQTNKKRVTQTL
ncbi:hypothetical protein ACTWQB_17105, partial [Piscibacillus sp. B03]